MRNQTSDRPQQNQVAAEQGTRGRGEPRRGRAKETEMRRPSGGNRAGHNRPEDQAGGPEHRGLPGDIDKNP